MFSRRFFLSSIGCIPFSSALSQVISDKKLNYGSKVVDGILQYDMVAKNGYREIVNGVKSQVIEYHILGQPKNMPFPVIRAKVNQKIRIVIKNEMDKTTTVHWHGIRIDNKMDGVPYLTQEPIKSGETYVYEFVCPDAGTFWFHSHQNSLEQMSRGQVGVLIVEEEDINNPAIKQFSADAVWVAKDYYIDDKGELTNCTTKKTAMTSGAFGMQKRVNGKEKSILRAPAGSWVRVRLLNCDNTRLMNISAYDEQDNKVEAFVIAIEGNPLKKYKLLNRDDLTPGQRLEIAIKVPKSGFVAIKNVFQKNPYILGVVMSNGNPVNEKALLPLPMGKIPEPDLKNAKRLRFIFLASSASMGRFWSINGKSMVEHSSPDDHKLTHNSLSCTKGMKNEDMPIKMNNQKMAEPLAVLEKNKSYIFYIQNGTPHTHPVHLHGFSFKVLKSNRYKINPYYTDTYPLKPDERIQIAFLADNVGCWMFHCHIIEHSATGMMGYIKVI